MLRFDSLRTGNVYPHFDGKTGMKATKIVKENDVDVDIDPIVVKKLTLRIILDCDNHILEFYYFSEKNENTKIYTIHLPKTQSTYFPCCNFYTQQPQKCKFLNDFNSTL